jgi:AcrR family transcriptional regulator
MSHGWETRQRRTRSEILAAVGDIIATDGLDGLTMRKLAERANVAVATLYNQFTDRNGVLVAFVSSGLYEHELALD